MSVRGSILCTAGLVVGLTLGGVFVGRATGQGPAPMQRWEYFCQNDIETPWKPKDLARLNALGAQGWELVQQLVGTQGSNGDVFCFRRPLR